MWTKLHPAMQRIALSRLLPISVFSFMSHHMSHLFQPHHAQPCAGWLILCFSLMSWVCRIKTALTSFEQPWHCFCQYVFVSSGVNTYRPCSFRLSGS